MNCRLDCPFNIDTLFSGENFSQYWFVQLMFGILFAGVLLASYGSIKQKK